MPGGTYDLVVTHATVAVRVSPRDTNRSLRYLKVRFRIATGPYRDHTLWRAFTPSAGIHCRWQLDVLLPERVLDAYLGVTDIEIRRRGMDQVDSGLHTIAAELVARRCRGQVAARWWRGRECNEITDLLSPTEVTV